MLNLIINQGVYVLRHKCRENYTHRTFHQSIIHESKALQTMKYPIIVGELMCIHTLAHSKKIKSKM